MPRLPIFLLIFLQIQASLLQSLNASAQPNVNDSLLGIVRENRQDLAECKALAMLAANYARTDLSKEKTCLYQAIGLALSLKNVEQADNIYGQMVSAQWQTGHPDSAKYFLSLVKGLADEKACSFCRSNYYFIAGLFYKVQGKYRDALPFMLESLKLQEGQVKTNPSVNFRTALAGQNLNIGNTYTSMGDYRNALRYHLDALRIFEEANNKRGISFCYQSLGTDFLMLGQFAQAREYTEKAIALKSELGDQRGRATSLQQLGDVWLGLKVYDSALSYYAMTLKIDREMKLSAEEANVSANIGQTYALKNDPVNARLYFSQSRALALQVGDSTRVAAVDASLVALQTKVHQERRNEQRLINSLNTSIEQGDMNAQLLNYRYIADHYASIRQYDKALDYTIRYHQLNDSLMSKDVQIQVKRMEEQYNLEKKEQEIALLKKDQELTHLSLQKQKAFQLGALVFLVLLLFIGVLIVNRYRIVHNARRLIEMEKMRNRIARDLHDDIGSTLTSINVLSNVALHPQENGEVMMRANMQKIKNRSSALMESMSDIVWAINPQNDTMEQLLFRMKEFAAELLEPLNITYTFEELGDFSSIRLDIKKRKDIYLLFKEAINNAAKYSRCKNLHIRLSQHQQSLRMEISDDGTGFVEQDVRTGNGLNNMRERAASMAAEILIDPIIGRGTRIALDLPIS